MKHLGGLLGLFLAMLLFAWAFKLAFDFLAPCTWYGLMPYRVAMGVVCTFVFVVKTIRGRL